MNNITAMNLDRIHKSYYEHFDRERLERELHAIIWRNGPTYEDRVKSAVELPLLQDMVVTEEDKCTYIEVDVVPDHCYSHWSVPYGAPLSNVYYESDDDDDEVEAPGSQQVEYRPESPTYEPEDLPDEDQPLSERLVAKREREAAEVDAVPLAVRLVEKPVSGERVRVRPRVPPPLQPYLYHKKFRSPIKLHPLRQTVVMITTPRQKRELLGCDIVSDLDAAVKAKGTRPRLPSYGMVWVTVDYDLATLYIKRGTVVIGYLPPLPLVWKYGVNTRWYNSVENELRARRSMILKSVNHPRFDIEICIRNECLTSCGKRGGNAVK